MKNFVVRLLMLIVLAAVPVYPQRVVTVPADAQRSSDELSPFTEAERNGDPNARMFFVFSTSFAGYVLRHDGMGEVTLHGGLRKVFTVKVGAKQRIERVYSLEYAGDLLLLYEAGDAGYLVRLNQRTRKLKIVATMNKDFAPPVIKDQHLIFNDGTVVPLN